MRAAGEAVGHVMTDEYGSQMLSLGGVHHLTGGGKKEGRVTCDTLLALCNDQPVELTIDGGATIIVQAGKAPIVNPRRSRKCQQALIMAIANKAFVWALFAAGGTLTALLFPALIALFLLVALGPGPRLEFEALHGFAASWAGRLVLFVLVALPAWHAAHRLRVLAHDFGLRADRAVAMVVYALAAVATVLAAVLALQVGTA